MLEQAGLRSIFLKYKEFKASIEKRLCFLVQMSDDAVLKFPSSAAFATGDVSFLVQKF